MIDCDTAPVGHENRVRPQGVSAMNDSGSVAWSGDCRLRGRVAAAVGIGAYNAGVAQGLRRAERAGAGTGDTDPYGYPTLASPPWGLRASSRSSSCFRDPMVGRCGAGMGPAAGIAVTVTMAACRRNSRNGIAARMRATAPAEGMKQILVVDDEPRIAAICRDYLERAGFKVISRRQRRRCPDAGAREAAGSHRPRPRACRRWMAST